MSLRNVTALPIGRVRARKAPHTDQSLNGGLVTQVYSTRVLATKWAFRLTKMRHRILS